jgi:RNA polymerase sigma-70 factor (ECF subfamily)
MNIIGSAMRAEATVLLDSKDAMAADESSTVSAAAGGDRIAFEQLYRRHAGRVHGLCLRLTGHRETAEDCVQETFVQAWRGLDRFEGRSAFTTWLHRIAVNAVLSRRRGLARTRETAADAAPDDAERAGVDAAPPLDLEAAIAALPDGARHVLVLVGIYGFSHAEAAESLDIAVGTSKAQFHRARRLLAARLELPLEES